MGCQLGLMDETFTYIRVSSGIDTDASYLYKGDDTCRYKSANIGATDSGFVDITHKDESALQRAVATVGPISVAIDASNSSFQDDTCRYKSANIGATDSGFVDITHKDESALQRAVATVGPISVAIDASNSSFQDDTCRYKSANVGATDSGFVDIMHKDESALQRAVATVGPISVAIDASNSSFQDDTCRYKSANVGATDSGFVDITHKDESALQRAVATVGPISVAIDARNSSFQDDTCRYKSANVGATDSGFVDITHKDASALQRAVATVGPISVAIDASNSSFQDDTCRYKSANVGATDSGFVDITHKDESALQRAVATVGPISVAIDASNSSFQDDTCRYKSANVGATDSGFVDIMHKDESALQRAVATVGPISVAIDASNSSFQDDTCRYKSANVGATDSGFVDITHKDESALQRAVATVGPISVAIDARNSSFQDDTCRYKSANVGATDSGFVDITHKDASALQRAVATVGPISVAIDASNSSFQDDTCRYKSANVGATDSGFVDITHKDESALQRAVATVGPISVAIDASNSSFQDNNCQ